MKIAKGKHKYLEELDLAKIDVEIRSIVKAVNRIPFAETLSSCAGYGKPGDHERDLSEGGTKAHAPIDEDTYQGYLIIVYDKNYKEWKTFHNILDVIVDKSEDFGYWRKKLNLPVFTYQVTGDIPHLKRVWSNVRKFLRELDLYLKGD